MRLLRTKPSNKPPRALAGFCVLFLLLLFQLFPTESAATIGIQMMAGISDFNVNAGSTFSQDGGLGLEVRPQVNLDFSTFNSSLFIAYQGRYGSNFGDYPLSRTGVGFQYYPAGMPIDRVVLDNGVIANRNRFEPFIVGQLGLAVIAVTDTSSGNNSFNALTVGYQVGGGAEFPLAPTYSLVTEFLIDGTVAGGASGDVSTGVSVRAYSLLFGFALHP